MSTPQHPQQGSNKRQRIEKEEKDNKMEKATEKEEKQATPPDSLVKDPLWTEFQERANRVIKREGGTGIYIIRGARDKEEENEEGEWHGWVFTPKPRKYKPCTEEEIQRLRVLVVTKRRKKEYTKSMTFLSRNQLGEGCMLFKTHDGNEVIEELIRCRIKNCKSRKELSSRFDALFGLTFALQKLDYWMYDNEYGGIFINKIIKMLGHAWMKILQKTDAQLGIDAEYTRPAIECLLTQMEEYFGDCEYATLPFTWQ